jgi:murein DD-endopeptidase MepM/ murein hydrolase activator NlpD
MRTAQEYGLPEGNTQTSAYGVNRVHHTDGSVDTVSDEYQRNPETDKGVRRHKGIDYSSNDASGKPSPLDFSTPVGGTVVYNPNDPWNTVTVTTDAGETMIFRHASEVYVKTGQRVSPGTTIGKTGNTAPAPVPIQLHVEATDKDGNPIDPNTLR